MATIQITVPPHDVQLSEVKLPICISKTEAKLLNNFLGECRIS
jgi:hypothetical protein